MLGIHADDQIYGFSRPFLSLLNCYCPKKSDFWLYDNCWEMLVIPPFPQDIDMWRHCSLFKTLYYLTLAHDIWLLLHLYVYPIILFKRGDSIFNFLYFVVSWQILQCLSIQGLTSSGGSGAGGDGVNSSGVSRALVRDRLLTWILPYTWIVFDWLISWIVFDWFISLIVFDWFHQLC